MAKEKSPTITVDGVTYLRVPVKTHLITDKDNIVEVIDQNSKSER